MKLRRILRSIRLLVWLIMFLEYSKEYQKGELKIKIIVIIKRQQQICQSLNVPFTDFQESVATGMAHVI